MIKEYQLIDDPRAMNTKFLKSNIFGLFIFSDDKVKNHYW
jgi:hypothetical protein